MNATGEARVNGREVDSPARRLRDMLFSNELEFLMEAHNGLSARIVAEAGFKGIWASGLALSAQFGVRDNNEASWTQVVDMLEFMADAAPGMPILLDGDTGYGNFNNMRRLVRKLEQRGIAGVCIEDKLFPKTNSFIGGERQPLADIEEFSGKLKAGKDSQRDGDFCIVARVEALIAGWGMDEAMRRAHAYADAGADAILIHSKLSRPDEVLEFARQWRRRTPVVVVPTKYYSTPTDVFRKAGIDLAIWANHLLRASAAAMADVANTIHSAQSLLDVEDRIAPVDEIFRLQGADELRAAERRYFSDATGSPRAVVLAASRGEGLESLTEERPKVMVPVAGKSLLSRLVAEFKHQRMHDIRVVAGYRAEAIDLPGVQVIRNECYAQGGELTSLACARDELGDDAVIVYGDLLFRSYILADLLTSEYPVTVVVDSALGDSPISGTPDYAWCNLADDRGLFGREVKLSRVANDLGALPNGPQGRFIGMLRVRGEGVQWLGSALDELAASMDLTSLSIPDLLNHLIEQNRAVHVHYVHGHWLDVNHVGDLDRAGRFADARLLK